MKIISLSLRKEVSDSCNTSLLIKTSEVLIYETNDLMAIITIPFFGPI